MTTPTPRERLTLPGSAAVKNGGATTMSDKKKHPPAQPRSALAAASNRAKNDIREFRFLDSERPISIYRHAIHWAAPKRDNSEATLVGIRCGEKPVPLQIEYSEFMQWWRGERDNYSNCDSTAKSG